MSAAHIKAEGVVFETRGAPLTQPNGLRSREPSDVVIRMFGTLERVSYLVGDCLHLEVSGNVL